VTVVIGIIGTIAGVFGMTFDTPLSHTGTNGLFLVTAAMLASEIGILILARLRSWI